MMIATTPLVRFATILRYQVSHECTARHMPDAYEHEACEIPFSGGIKGSQHRNARGAGSKCTEPIRGACSENNAQRDGDSQDDNSAASTPRELRRIRTEAATPRELRRIRTPIRRVNRVVS